MWHGLAGGRLVLFEGGRVRTQYDQAALGGIGQATCVSSVSALVVCGEAGVAVMHEGRFQRLRAQRDEVLASASAGERTVRSMKFLGATLPVVLLPNIKEFSWVKRSSKYSFD